MKSRAIQTRFWDDENVSEFSSNSKYLYIYLLTCQYINVSGVFQLSIKKIKFETGLTDKQFEKSQQELSKCEKVLFYNGWVYVVNSEKNNNYRKIPSNEVTYQREWERVPTETRSYFNNIVPDPSVTPKTTPSPIPGRLNINNKTQLINNKSQTINNKTQTVEKESLENSKKKLYKKMNWK